MIAGLVAPPAYSRQKSSSLSCAALFGTAGEQPCPLYMVCVMPTLSMAPTRQYHGPGITPGRQPSPTKPTPAKRPGLPETEHCTSLQTKGREQDQAAWQHGLRDQRQPASGKAILFVSTRFAHSWFGRRLTSHRSTVTGIRQRRKTAATLSYCTHIGL